MNRNRRRLALAAAGLALAAAVAVPLVATAGTRPGARGTEVPTAPLLLRYAAERLDLDASQREAIRDIVAAHAPQLEAQAKAVLAARERLFAAVHAAEADPRAIRLAAAAVGTAEGDLALTRAEIVEEVRGVLTAEQEAEAQAMLAEAKARIEALVERVFDHLALLGA